MKRRLSQVNQEGFSATVTVVADYVVLQLEGTGDMAAVPALERCLQEIHAEVATQGLRAVEIDLAALYLLNSSCLKALIAFLYVIQTDGPRYQVRFLTDARLSWQARTLAVVQRMAPELVSITARGS